MSNTQMEPDRPLSGEETPLGYRVVELLGQGGFGRVYLAKQESTGQTVALKLLRTDIVTKPEARERLKARFRREAKLCSELQHAHIVALLDSGTTEQGSPFAVFEYVPGTTLRDCFARRTLSRPQLVRVMAQVLDALAAAHSQGVVHRDLKPDNIMVSQAGAGPNAKVLDFGVGALISQSRVEAHARGDTEARLTLSRETVGTPSYSAPEQLRGAPPTHKSDIYSWGLVLLEGLLGKPVMSGSSVAEIYNNQLSSEEVPLPSALFRHPLGPYLRSVLQKSAEERRGDTAELWMEFQRLDLTNLVGELHTPVGGDSSLSGHQPTASIASARNEPPSANRHPISVLCCSLMLEAIGNNELDVEIIETLQRDQLQLAKEAVSYYGAHISSVLGDRFVALFGYPSVSDSDARRAGRAALELQAQAQRRAPVLEQRYGLGLKLSIGLHTGMVLREQSHAPRGRTVDVAVRLESLAEPGTILATAATERTLGQYLEFDTSDVVVQGGEAKPLSTFRLLGERVSEALRFRSGSGPDQSLLGRSHELESLHAAWKRAQDGAQQVLLLLGEAGIGKSRLTAAFREALASQEVRSLEARCLPEKQNTALHPWIGLLRRALQEESGKSELLAPALVERLRRQQAPLDISVPLACTWLSIAIPAPYRAGTAPPDEQQRQSFQIFEDLLLGLGTERPTLLVLEDAHWSDPTTFELIKRMLPRLATTQCLLLVTARPTFTRAWLAPDAPQLKLEGLGAEAARTMTARAAGGKELPAEVVENVLERTDGVPLFIEELTRTIIETQLTLKDDSYVYTNKGSAIRAVPVSLNDSLASRLSRLGPVLRTAQVASALGRNFDAAVVAAVSERDDASTQADLDALVTAELIYPRRRAGSNRYIFRHALIRDVAYESMAANTRRTVHQAIVGYLKATPNSRSGQNSELARHHAGAGNYHEAIQLRLLVAHAALERSLPAESLGHCRQALSWLSKLPAGRGKDEAELKLQGLLVPVLMGTDGFGANETVAAGRRCQALLERLDRDDGDQVGSHYLELAWRSEWALFNHYHFHSHRSEARQLGERLAQRARRNDKRQWLVGALPMLAQAMHADGDLLQARDTLAEVLKLYDTELDPKLALEYGSDSLVFSHSTLAMLYDCLGEEELAGEHAQRGMDWAAKTQHSVSADIAYLLPTLVRAYHGDRCGVHRLLNEHAKTFSSAAEQRWMTTHFNALRGWLMDDCTPLQDYLASSVASGQQYATSWYEMLLAEVYVRARQTDRAEQLLHGTLERCQSRSERWTLPLIFRWLAKSHIAATSVLDTTSEEYFRRAIDSALDIAARGWVMRLTEDYAEELANAERHLEAAEALSSLERLEAEIERRCRSAPLSCTVRRVNVAEKPESPGVVSPAMGRRS